MQKCTREDIKNMAHLAKLEIKESDIENHVKNFTNIINVIEKIHAIDTQNIAPMSHPFNLNQRLRKDEITESDQRELFQNLAPKKTDGLYLVPNVIE